MLSIQALKEYGANTDEGLKRCFGNEAFYLKLVASVPKEASFTKLSEAMAGGDLNAGFEAAHALKGVLANLSMTPILAPVEELTELLRARTEMDYDPLLNKVTEEFEKLKKICEE